MPAIDKQTYKESGTFKDSTAGITPDYRASVADACIGPCKKSDLVAAGFFSDNQAFTAIANSKGNFGYQKTTGVDFTCTVRTSDGKGSGWVARNLADVSKFDAKSEIQIAMKKAKDSVEAKALEPGKYTVVLEPAASAGLISFMMFGFDARQADEGRSFLTEERAAEPARREGVRRARQHPCRSVGSDAACCRGTTRTTAAREERRSSRRAKVEYLQYSRFWAEGEGQEGDRPARQPDHGSAATKSTAELVKSTKKGVLVTRTWYIRIVDPQTVLLTGLTRDGTFYIENGEIKYPIKNFRLQRVAGDHAEQRRGVRQAGTRRRRRVAVHDDDPADEAARLHVQLAVGRGVMTGRAPAMP
jgi:hypothetical protein